MKLSDGTRLNSRGVERVTLHDRKEYRKTVWQHPTEWKFYTKVDGVFVEVYHYACSFGVFKPKND